MKSVRKWLVWAPEAFVLAIVALLVGLGTRDLLRGDVWWALFAFSSAAFNAVVMLDRRTQR